MYATLFLNPFPGNLLAAKDHWAFAERSRPTLGLKASKAVVSLCETYLFVIQYCRISVQIVMCR